MRSDGEEPPELIDSDDDLNDDDNADDDEDGVGSDASSEAGAACMVCGSTASGPGADRMLLCDGKGCENGCHLRCHKPPLKKVPRGDWFCGSCVPLGSTGNAAAATEGCKPHPPPCATCNPDHAHHVHATLARFSLNSPARRLSRSGVYTGAAAGRAAAPRRVEPIESNPQVAAMRSQFAALVGTDDEALAAKLHLRQAVAYRERLFAFVDDAPDAESRREQMQQRLHEHVQKHVDLFNGLTKETPFHPFATDAEYTSFIRAGEQKCSQTQWKTNLGDLRRIAGDTAQPKPDDTEQPRLVAGRRQRRARKQQSDAQIMDRIKKVPTYAIRACVSRPGAAEARAAGCCECRVEFESKPIPDELLSELETTRPGVGAKAFMYRSPLLALQDKLMQPGMAGRVHWDCVVQKNEDGERQYAEFHTGDAALCAQARFCQSSEEKLLALAVYADKAGLDGGSRHDYYGVMLDFLNQYKTERQSLSGPILIGMIPVFHGSGKKVAEARMKVWQWCVGELLNDLKVGCNGLDFCARFGTIDGSIACCGRSHVLGSAVVCSLVVVCVTGSEDDLTPEWRKCYPVVLAFEGDHPETKCCCCLKGGNTLFPCNVCGVMYYQLHNIDGPEFELRSQDDLTECHGARAAFESTVEDLNLRLASLQIDRGTFNEEMRAARAELKLQGEMLTSMSGLNAVPAFKKLGYVDANLSIAMELLHLLDQGIVPRFLLLTARFFDSQRKLDELNLSWMEQPGSDDLARILPGPLFKKDGNKIELAAMPKASEMRQILQFFPTVVRFNDQVYAVWVALCKLYELAHQKAFTMKQIVELQESVVRCGRKLLDDSVHA